MEGLAELDTVTATPRIVGENTAVGDDAVSCEAEAALENVVEALTFVESDGL